MDFTYPSISFASSAASEGVTSAPGSCRCRSKPRHGFESHSERGWCWRAWSKYRRGRTTHRASNRTRRRCWPDHYRSSVRLSWPDERKQQCRGEIRVSAGPGPRNEIRPRGCCRVALEQAERRQLHRITHRVTGSGAFSAAARAVFLIVSQPDSGQRLFLPGKNNVGREQPGLVFEIEERDTPSGIRAPAIRWTGESVTMTADEALAAVAGGVEEHGALPKPRAS